VRLLPGESLPVLRPRRPDESAPRRSNESARGRRLRRSRAIRRRRTGGVVERDRLLAVPTHHRDLLPVATHLAGAEVDDRRRLRAGATVLGVSPPLDGLGGSQLVVPL